MAALAFPYYKFTVFTNYKSWGWTDTFYYGNSEAYNSPGQIAAATALLRALWAKSGLGVEIPAVRATLLNASDPLLKSGQQANFYLSADLGLGLPKTPPPIANSWVGPLFTIPDRGFVQKRPWITRGMPYTWTNQAAITATPSAVSSDMLAWKDQFNLKVCGITAAGGQAATPYTGQFALKGVIKDPSQNLATDVSVLDFDPVTLRFRVTFVPPIGWSNRPDVTGPWVGQWVVLRGFKLRCGKGENGKAQITVVENLTNGVFRVTLNKRWCCAPSPIDVKTYGKISILKYGLFSLGRMSFERFVKHDTGRPFFGTVGKAAAKCC